MTLVRQTLDNFSDNIILIQFFAYLNSVSLFVDTYRRQAQSLVQRISGVNVTETEIQEVGEDLGIILGTVLEAKLKSKELSIFWRD